MQNNMPITKEQAQAELNRRRSKASISTESDDLRKRAQSELDRRRSIFSIPEMPPDADVTTFPELIGKAKAFGNEIVSESPALAGATGGAAVGFSAGGPIGGIVGAMGGGIIGKLSQEGVEQGMLRTGLAEEGDILTQTEPLRRKDFDEVLLESGMTGIQLGAGEALGQGLIAPFAKAGRGFSKNVTPEGRETLEFFKGTGITPNPAKVTDSRLLDLASNAGEASIFGGEKFLQGQIKAVDFIDDTIERLVGKSSQSKQTLGELFEDAIQNPVTGSHKAFSGAAKTLFNRIDQAVGQRFVDTAGIRVQSSKLIDELSGLGVEPSLISKLQGAGETSIGGAGLQQTGLRFSEAQALRSDLLAVIRKSKDTISDKAVGRVKSIVGKLESEMESTARSAGGNVLDQWRKANRFWKEGIDTFNSKVIKDIVRKDPDAAVSSLFTAAKDKPVTVRRIKRALKDKQLIRDLEDSTLKEIMFRSRNELGDIVPSKLLNQLKAFGGRDGAALKAMFPRGQDKQLAKLARIKGVILKGQPDATGRFAVQIGQVTAGASLLSGKFKKTALTILMVPDMIARLFRSPGAVKFITEGAKARPGTKAAVTFTTRLSALLSKEGIEHEIINPGTDISPTRENARILQQQQGVR